MDSKKQTKLTDMMVAVKEGQSHGESPSPKHAEKRKRISSPLQHHIEQSREEVSVSSLEFEKDTPAWVIKLCDILDSRFTNRSNKTEEALNNALEFMSDKIDALQEEVTQKNVEINLYKQQIEYQSVRIEKLEERLDGLENRSRRNNLVFILPNNDMQDEDCEVIVRDIMKDKMKMEDTFLKGVRIGRCHRLYKGDRNKQEIICYFESYTDKTVVWEHRSKLKGSNIWLREDFAESTVKKRNLLYPFMIAARKNGYRATISVDKLIVNGRLYTESTLETLPEDICPESVYTKITDEALLFYTPNTKFSNMYKTKFVCKDLNGTTRGYHSVEQYICVQKCLEKGDTVTLDQVVKCPEPLECKKLTKNINVSRESISSYMLNGMREKFSQNSGLKMSLVNTGSRLLAEANPHDNYWGIGLKLWDLKAVDPSNWPGQNMMGTNLATIRNELQQRSKPKQQ